MEEVYENTIMKCINSKKEIVNNKEKYASLFSEGRKNLEELLLSSYNKNIMTTACCSGHIGEYDERSYISFEVRKCDLAIFSNIIRLFKDTNLHLKCDIEESFNAKCYNKYLLFCIRPDYYEADNVYTILNSIINNTNNNHEMALEYEVLYLLKKDLLEFRKRIIPKYGRGILEAGDIELIQTGGDICDPCGKFIKINRIIPTSTDSINMQPSSQNKDLESLLKILSDNNKVNYTNLVGRYEYEDDKQLIELKKVLLKNR